MSMTKNASREYFWVRILKKLLSYLKPAPSNLSNCKMSQKSKNSWIWGQILPKRGTKNAFFGYFWAEICKQYCNVWNKENA